MARERPVRAVRAAALPDAAAQGWAAQGAKALELLAEELRLAHDVLGEITGAYSSDALLGDIFGRFCIGK
jgi:tRNA modification GTPase